MKKLHYAFLDESGILERGHFIISVIIVANSSDLRQIIKIAKRKAKGRFKTHEIFKAHKEDKGFVKLVLQELAKRDIYITIGVWDQKNEKVKLDRNSLYVQLLARTVSMALAIYPKLNLVIHKRYASPRIRQQITQALSEIVKSGNFLSVDQRTENECRELELADAVAWAVFQKYNNKEAEFYEIFKKRIVKENRLVA